MASEAARRIVDEPEGEGYFASVSDLMVGILFVFLLMLTVFALNYQTSTEDVEKLKAELVRLEALARERAEAAERARREAEQAKIEADAQRRLAELERQEAERQRQLAEAERERNAELQRLLARQRQALLRALDLLDREVESRQRTREVLLERMRERLHERGVIVQIDHRSGVLRLPERELRFPTRSAELGPEERRAVRVLAEVMAEVLPCFAEGGARTGCAADDQPVLETVLIEGHTDRRPLAPDRDFRDNLQLSAARALTVYRALAADRAALLGLLNPDRQPLLGVSGYGETRPLPAALGDSERDLAANRRIDIRFILSARTTDEIERLREEIRRALGEIP
ncbi:MAG: OmpA family protein [Geminicoccaceae bacterium]|nr:OmpA family protein [Geminicoccaceae bacterium]MDW8371405.1 OmpA family protein [Geminicoccaceae bacterium]